MLRDIIHYIYCLPLSAVITAALAFVAVWALLCYFIPDKAKKRLNIAVLIICIAVIICTTLFLRERGSFRALILRPLNGLYGESFNKAAPRTTLMNIVLFIPFGVSAPFVMNKSTSKKVLRTVFAAFILSVAIETIQYTLALGRTEIDDVACNVIGAAIGTLAFIPSYLSTKRSGGENK